MTKEPTTHFIVVPVTDPDVDSLWVEHCRTIDMGDGKKDWDILDSVEVPVPEDDTLQEDIRRLTDFYAANYAVDTDDHALVSRVRSRFHLDDDQ